MPLEGAHSVHGNGYFLKIRTMLVLQPCNTCIEMNSADLCWYTQCSEKSFNKEKLFLHIWIHGSEEYTGTHKMMNSPVLSSPWNSWLNVGWIKLFTLQYLVIIKWGGSLWMWMWIPVQRSRGYRQVLSFLP